MGPGKKAITSEEPLDLESRIQEPDAIAIYQAFPSLRDMGLGSAYTVWFFGAALLVAIFVRPWGFLYALLPLVLGMWNRRRMPVRMGAVYLRARSKALIGKYEEALEILKVLDGVVPSRLLSLVRGYCSYGAKDEKGAIKYYLEYLREAPEDVKTATRCASLLLKDGRAFGALKLLDKIPQPFDEEPLVIGLKGASLVASGKMEEAVEVFETAPLGKDGYDPIITTIRYSLGQAYQALGKEDQAQAQYRRVYRDDPDFENIKDIIKSMDEGRA